MIETGSTKPSGAKRASDGFLIGVENTSFVVEEIQTSADVTSDPNNYSWSMKQHIEILIVTRSIPLADGLDALLKAIPQVDGVQTARNLENATQQIENRKPQIVLIDSALLGSKPDMLLEKIFSLSPTTQRVILADDVQAVKWMPRYAEAILIKGASPSAITTIVTNLLLAQGDEHEHDDANSK